MNCGLRIHFDFRVRLATYQYFDEVVFQVQLMNLVPVPFQVFGKLHEVSVVPVQNVSDTESHRHDFAEHAEKFFSSYSVIIYGICSVVG